MNETDIAWSAGILEGEGSFFNKKGSRAPIVTIQMTDLDVLKKMQELFGGNIYETKKRKSHWKDCWKWTISSNDEAAYCIRTVYPYLFNRRKEKADEVLSVWEQVKLERLDEEARIRERRKTIQELYETDKFTHKELGELFDMHRTYVSHICRGRYD